MHGLRLALISLAACLPFPTVGVLHLHRRDLNAPLLDSYDYIVVGCGISGLVVTNRLTEDPSVNVLCVEAGDADQYEPIIQNPVYVGADIGGIYDWLLSTTPQTQLDGAARPMPQGKALGGGSILNAMCWNRGGQDDYDAWAALGNPGWDWEGLLPYFIKFDPNDGSSAGAAFVPTDLDPINQTRSDARRTYFDPYVSRPNFHVITGQHVTRLLIEGVGSNFVVSNPTPGGNEDGNGMNGMASNNGFGFGPGGSTPALENTTDARLLRRQSPSTSDLRITGVEFAATASDARRTISATREVIVAAGALHSAQLLQLSGIGPSSLLDAYDIPIALDLPGVGNNLQDHCLVGTFYPYNNASYPSPTELTTNVSYNAMAEMEYNTFKTAGSPNALAFNPLPLISNNSASILTAANDQDPTTYLPGGLDPTIIAGYTLQKQSLVRRLAETTVASYEIINNNAGSLTVAVMHPFSRGQCYIRSADPFEPPSIDPRWLTNPVDRQVLIEALLFNRQILATPAMLPLLPAQFVPTVDADEDAINAIIDTGIRTEFHPSGTCAMLPLEQGGVVDPRLRVYGAQNLRVVDAGIFPMIPAAHLQAVVYAVAEKAADIIKADNVGVSSSASASSLLASLTTSSAVTTSASSSTTTSYTTASSSVDLTTTSNSSTLSSSTAFASSSSVSSDPTSASASSVFSSNSTAVSVTPPLKDTSVTTSSLGSTAAASRSVTGTLSSGSTSSPLFSTGSQTPSSSPVVGTTSSTTRSPTDIVASSDSQTVSSGSVGSTSQASSSLFGLVNSNTPLQTGSPPTILSLSISSGTSALPQSTASELSVSDSSVNSIVPFIGWLDPNVYENRHQRYDLVRSAQFVLTAKLIPSSDFLHSAKLISATIYIHAAFCGLVPVTVDILAAVNSLVPITVDLLPPVQDLIQSFVSVYITVLSAKRSSNFRLFAWSNSPGPTQSRVQPIRDDAGGGIFSTVVAGSNVQITVTPPSTILNPTQLSSSVKDALTNGGVPTAAASALVPVIIGSFDTTMSVPSDLSPSAKAVLESAVMEKQRELQASIDAFIQWLLHFLHLA
ncbi:MAG: hypothetical protein Q9173_001465 [Seirophora scorigena]